MTHLFIITQEVVFNMFQSFGTHEFITGTPHTFYIWLSFLLISETNSSYWSDVSFEQFNRLVQPLLLRLRNDERTIETFRLFDEHSIALLLKDYVGDLAEVHNY